MTGDNGKSGKAPQAEKIRYVQLYDTGEKIYTRKITGFYQNVRRYTGLPLIIAYVLLPWINIDGRPAIFFDLPAREFHIFWITFWPQDFMLLAWALIIAAFSLFTVTALLGRVYCGFTCPQTVWTLMFMSIEHFFEGDRNKQIKLDKQAWTLEKFARKSAKHFVWGLIALITGLTFVGYFVPIRELLLGLVPFRNDLGMLVISAPPAAVFWTLFFTGMTYLNAGWMREQVCKYMCPYARFQSVMYDQKTLAVHYDASRGEPRAARKKADNPRALGLGDCTDCSWCVQVCPVDIDIRDGLQYECINCGLCVDACNAVMDKMQYPRGLISYSSEEALATGKLNFFRPRLIGYSVAVLLMLLVFSYSVFEREPLSLDVVRDRGARLYRVGPTDIQNVYTLKINNMDRIDRSFVLSATGNLPYEIKNRRTVFVESGEVYTVPVRVSVAKAVSKSEKTQITFKVYSSDAEPVEAIETSNFFAPKQP